MSAGENRYPNILRYGHLFHGWPAMEFLLDIQRGFILSQAFQIGLTCSSGFLARVAEAVHLRVCQVSAPHAVINSSVVGQSVRRVRAHIIELDGARGLWPWYPWWALKEKGDWAV